MPGRPIRLITATVASALAVALSASAALACHSCEGCASVYVPPPAILGSCASCAPSYEPPTVYSSPCNSGYVAAVPTYRVDLGPTYRAPVAVVEEPVPDYGYPRRYPYVSHSGRSWAYAHHNHRVRAIGGPHHSDRPELIR
jgi:hypothetical protein